GPAAARRSTARTEPGRDARADRARDHAGAGPGAQPLLLSEAPRPARSRARRARPGVPVLRRRQIGAAADPTVRGRSEPQRGSEPGLVTLLKAVGYWLLALGWKKRANSQQPEGR